MPSPPAGIPAAPDGASSHRPFGPFGPFGQRLSFDRAALTFEVAPDTPATVGATCRARRVEGHAGTPLASAAATQGALALALL